LRKHRIKIAKHHPRTIRDPFSQIIPHRSSSNNSIETINKGDCEAKLRNETVDRKMKALSRRLKQINFNYCRIPKDNNPSSASYINISKKLPIRETKFMHTSKPRRES
jgi:hypothetical protein